MPLHEATVHRLHAEARDQGNRVPLFLAFIYALHEVSGICRLQQTARQLKSESQPLALSMTLPTHRAATGAASDLMFYVTAEGKPSNYSRSFEFLLDWVDNSLDMYKAGPLSDSSSKLYFCLLFCLSIEQIPFCLRHAKLDID